MPADLETQLEQAQQVLAAYRRTATDRQYMIGALVQMLGPKGLQVWQMWQAQGIERVHTDWGPDAAAMSGEERAQAHLDLFEAAKNAEPLTRAQLEAF